MSFKSIILTLHQISNLLNGIIRPEVIQDFAVKEGGPEQCGVTWLDMGEKPK